MAHSTPSRPTTHQPLYFRWHLIRCSNVLRSVTSFVHPTLHTASSHPPPALLSNQLVHKSTSEETACETDTVKYKCEITSLTEGREVNTLNTQINAWIGVVMWRQHRDTNIASTTICSLSCHHYWQRGFHAVPHVNETWMNACRSRQRETSCVAVRHHDMRLCCASPTSGLARQLKANEGRECEVFVFAISLTISPLFMFQVEQQDV